MSAKRRVVITGMGLISPLGNSLSQFWENLSQGISGVAPMQTIPTDYLPVNYAAEVNDFSGKIDSFGDLDKDRKRAIRKNLKVMCRETQMGVAAAQLALTHSNALQHEYDPERFGIVFGSDYMMTRPEEFIPGVRECVGQEDNFEFSQWPLAGMKLLEPLWLLKYLPNMPASHLAIFNDLRGPNNSLTQREASANLAIAEAYNIILRGSADQMVAGSTGTRVHPTKSVHIALQEELAGNEISPEKASRPFDKNRSGLVLGEGSGAIILEEMELAQKRGATIYGEVVGYGSSSVSTKTNVAQYETAVTNVINQALKTAQLKPEQIGHIHAHGLSTHLSDIQEAQAISKIFGNNAKKIPVTGAKSYFGNLGAGSGMVELIGSLIAMQENKLFALLNYETPDPQCPINPATTSSPAGDCFLNLNHTPQGQASSVVISSC